MDTTMDKIRKIVNSNRVRFIETLPTALFIEAFPGLHHFKREQLKCRLKNDGEYTANSDLLDAILKVDNFPEQFIAFCDKHECCTDLKDLIRSVLIESHRYYSAQKNRTITSYNSRHGNSAVATITQPSDENSEVTVMAQQSCVTNAEFGEMHSGNTQNGRSVSLGASCDEIVGTRRDSQIEGADNNSLSNNDEVCRAPAMNNNMDNNLSAYKPSDGVKDIFGGSTSMANQVQATEENCPGEIDSACSSSFFISSIEMTEPDNEIENLKENPPAQFSEREESQIVLMSSYTSSENDHSNLKNAGECSKNISQVKSLASHSHKGSLVTEPQGFGAQEPVKKYSGVQCEEDMLKIKVIQEPAKNTHSCNTLEEALQNSCPLSALSETEALSSETRVKTFMNEPSLDENDIFYVETSEENSLSNSTFDQFQLVIQEPLISVRSAPNSTFDQLQPVIQEPLISVDSTQSSTFDQLQPVIQEPQISVDSVPSSVTLTENPNNLPDGSEEDVFNNQTFSSNVSPSQSQNDSSDSVSVRVFHALSIIAHYVVRQVLDSF